MSCVFLFSLIVDLYFPIPATIGKYFNSTTELAVPIIIPTNESKSENETNPVIKSVIIQCSLKPCKHFCASLINNFA